MTSGQPLTPYERLLLPENLYYAWQKAKRLYHMSDGYIDRGELLEFELDLENRLQNIERQFTKGKYELQPIRPVPRPKKLKGDECVHRQYYQIAVDDQVAWIAIVNALGPELDDQMPAWSYGNRLYRPAWYEEEQKESKLEIGPYRHSSGHLYKKFQHSWPRFRHDISLTSKAMVRPLKKEDQSEQDKKNLESATKQGLVYLSQKEDFWKDSRNQNNSDLYCASIDLKQFYPNIKSKSILSGLLQVQHSCDSQGKLETLLKGMLRFTLDRSDISPSVLKNVEPDFDEKKVKGLPTGLFAAGFLANAAMLKVDKLVDEKIKTDKNIAHFRFVDDHTIIAYDFEKLGVWIEWYKQLVKEQLGIPLNEDKYDPESLSIYLRTLNNKKVKPKTRRERQSIAQIDCKIDGDNPTKLLTKTLEKVSIIAGQNANVLDDNDLTDRLKDLEWLLLADIPEREIRPDTRAAFAAGQIAMLAPMLIQEADGIVDTHREIVQIKNELQLLILRKQPKENEKKISTLEEKLAIKEKEFSKQKENLQNKENGHLTRCFNLLIHAMKEHPGKARLFFRLHQYCLLTGHRGLKEIAKWIDGLRTQSAPVWADYYASLTLQILAQNILKALRVLATPSSLRSDREAAINHLEDISINHKLFTTSNENDSWFHKIARREYAASVAIATEYLKQRSDLQKLSSQFAAYSAPVLGESSSAWLEKTGYSAGNWAYLAESYLRADSSSSSLWEVFVGSFDYARLSDQRAIRLYPDKFPQKAWEHLISSAPTVKEDDSGWIYQILETKKDWALQAKATNIAPFIRAASISENHNAGYITLYEWTDFAMDCSVFDPRRSEWTALEIIKKIIQLKEHEIGLPSILLERLHPCNILLPELWKNEDSFLVQGKDVRPCPTWETWRKITSEGNIKLINQEDLLHDYRYYYPKEDSEERIRREGKFSAIGRLLLGILTGNYNPPVAWNIRGNEKAISIPRSRIFRELAISSRTLLIIEACIDPRSAESRVIPTIPEFFGEPEGYHANDTQYDPPFIINIDNLIPEIEKAQEILKDNQLSVSRHQPRQLIPFRVIDFAVSANEDSEEDLDA